MRTGEIVRRCRRHTNLKPDVDYIEVFVGERNSPATLGQLAFISAIPKDCRRASRKDYESGPSAILVEFTAWVAAITGPEARRLRR